MRAFQRFPVVLTTAIFLFAGPAAFSGPGNAQDSFEKLKALSGAWAGSNSQGDPLTVAYRLTARGSTLMSEIHGHDDMVSMFHMDGDRLLLTHYCDAGNQPRLQAEASPDGKTFAFDFVDGTNLEASKMGHMYRVVFTIVDANRHTEEWDYIHDGKEMKQFFDLQRREK
jgi:hypothetical protein